MTLRNSRDKVEKRQGGFLGTERINPIIKQLAKRYKERKNSEIWYHSIQLQCQIKRPFLQTMRSRIGWRRIRRGQLNVVDMDWRLLRNRMWKRSKLKNIVSCKATWSVNLLSIFCSQFISFKTWSRLIYRKLLIVRWISHWKNCIWALKSCYYLILMRLWPIVWGKMRIQIKLLTCNSSSLLNRAENSLPTSTSDPSQMKCYEKSTNSTKLQFSQRVINSMLMKYWITLILLVSWFNIDFTETAA